jgi:hypothetical protein
MNSSYVKSILFSKLLDPFNHSPWKVLLLGSMQKWGGNNILFLSKEGLDKIAEKVNPFWKDVITFDSACDEIRLEIQSRYFLRKFNLNEINPHSSYCLCTDMVSW